ncbi:MAG TPA: YdcF family protein [Steroidobacteraceae bacterium]|nr:YdcF family protein [Steroidobacteraceae bacterium]
MYFTLKALLRSLILPPGAPLLLAVLGAFLVWRRRRAGWPLLVFGLGSLWFLCTPIIADGLSRLAERYPPFDVGRPSDAQAIVILGGGGQRTFAPEYGGPVAEEILLERLMYGAFLAHRTGLPVLISGAPAEALVMQATLSRDLGVEPRWMEGKSRDTFQNAQFSQRMLSEAGITRVLLVTSSTHEWRAVQEFRAAGLQVTPAPAGVLAPRETGIFRFVPGTAALGRSTAALYELLGEPARRIQAALGVRERFDPSVRHGTF